MIGRALLACGAVAAAVQAAPLLTFLPAGKRFAPRPSSVSAPGRGNGEDATCINLLGKLVETGRADQSVHLVVTSPPYWTLKEYRDSDGQLGHIANYEDFLAELDDKIALLCRIHPQEAIVA